MRNIGKKDLIIRAGLVLVISILIIANVLTDFAAIVGLFVIAFQFLNLIIKSCYLYYFFGIDTYKKDDC